MYSIMIKVFTPHVTRLYNDNLVRRFVLPPDRFSWENPFNDYKPINFTDPSILNASFADPPNPGMG